MKPSVRRLCAIAGVALVFAALTTGASTNSGMAAQRHALPKTLVVFSHDGKAEGQVVLPAHGDGIDFTWTKTACAGGYIYPPIIGISTNNGHFRDDKVTLGAQVSSGSWRPYVTPCGPSTPAGIINDVAVYDGFFCQTYNGHTRECFDNPDTNNPTEMESHVWLTGGNTVETAFLMTKGSKTASSKTITVPPETNQIDVYPKGKVIPDMFTTGGSPSGTGKPNASFVHDKGMMNKGEGKGKVVGNRAFSESKGLNISWLEDTSCDSADGGPVTIIIPTATNTNAAGTKFAGPTKLAGPPLVVPCVGSTGGKVRTQTPKTSGVTVSFRPFTSTMTQDGSPTGSGPILTNAIANGAETFSYGGTFVSSGLSAIPPGQVFDVKKLPKATTSDQVFDVYATVDRFQ